MMVAITTVLGMIPLTQDPFFASMAVAIMFGLSFACVLTLIVAPVLFAIFYGIHEPAPAVKKRTAVMELRRERRLSVRRETRRTGPAT